MPIPEAVDSHARRQGVSELRQLQAVSELHKAGLESQQDVGGRGADREA
ncbi:hypothetical protein [Nonomuraea aurantiaca]|nr:hypothetical protein [Nonomuraea aurantiaca]MCA2229610.1 hypothetical protein [Nonomuraea aurantiaca]